MVPSGDGAGLMLFSTERTRVLRRLGTDTGTALVLAGLHGGDKNFNINTAGPAGVGTTGPAVSLHVNGSTEKLDAEAGNSSFHAIGLPGLRQTVPPIN